MRKLISAFCAAAFMASANIVPLAASPLVSPPRLEANDSLVQARSRCHRCYRSGNRHYSKRHYSSRSYGKRHYSSRNYGKRHYSNRHYGKRHYANRYYKHRRHNYNYYYDDWWWGPGLFFGGALLGYQQPYYRSYGGDAHVAWCYRRYRSYREWDNTFQPYHGPRRLCISPYG